MSTKRKSKRGVFLMWLIGLGLLTLAGWLWMEYRNPGNEPETGFTLQDGLKLQVIAREPDVINPMTMSVDEDGSIYVTESATYRYGTEGAPTGMTDNTIKRIIPGAGGRPKEVKIVARGFENPVMGLSVYDGKLYATCLNELFVMDITPTGDLVNRRLLIKDAAEPWNPFGMYRVTVGPDKRLWLAIADHPGTIPVTLTGSDGTAVKLSGQSGGIVRCNLDGSNLEMVVEGFRAPFAFDFDPWGNLWAVSNGEGSPNLYVKVIPGMDYGYQSRDVSYAWLAGKTALAPPVYEMGPGANTAALHYYSSMFHPSFWGSILMANWGSHGANPGNRSIKQFFLQMEPSSSDAPAEVLEETDQPLIMSADTMFRPTCLVTAPDGGLYLADWHGVDDESNQTGRIYKIISKYNTAPPGLTTKEIRKMDPGTLTGLLNNKNHVVREQAIRQLENTGEQALEALEKALAHQDPFVAAGAVWALTRMGTSAAAVTLAKGIQHPDERVRSMVLRQLRASLFAKKELASLAGPLTQTDPSAEVRLEAALALPSPAEVTKGLLHALDITSDRRLRYYIGFELGRNAGIAALSELAADADPEIRKVAFIAAETALNEHNALARSVADWNLGVFEQNRGEQLVRQVLSGEKGPTQISDRVAALKWLAAHPAEISPSVTSFLNACLEDPDLLVQMAVLEAISNSNLTNPEIGSTILKTAHNAQNKGLGFLLAEAIYALRSFTDVVQSSDWNAWISHTSSDVATAALRGLRQSNGSPELLDTLWSAAVKAAGTHPILVDDIAFTFREQAAADAKLKQYLRRSDNKQELARQILASLKEASIQRGKWAFATTCAACHTTDTETDIQLLGPGLASIGASARPEYIVESILEPSKILKTGFQMETLEMNDGRSLTGQVRTEGNKAIISNLGTEHVVVNIGEIKKRNTSHSSPMPAGLDNAMTVPELADLTAYLLSLKGTE